MRTHHGFLSDDVYPAAAVASRSVATLVLASSNVTTASLRSRLTRTFVTPFTFVNDLFTEVTHEPQVIPDTASVTVWLAGQATDENNIAAAISALEMIRFILLLFDTRSPHPAGTLRRPVI